MGDKVVNVRMSEECHAILKAYSAFAGRTMSEVLYDCCRQELHQEALKCRIISTLMKSKSQPLDKRTHKPCWGTKCYWCKHEVECKTGTTDLLFIMREELKPLLNPGYEWIGDLDGSSFDRPST